VHGPDERATIWRLAGELAAARTEPQAAGVIARAAALIAGADAVRIWLLDSREGYRFAGVWPETEKHPRTIPDSVPRAIMFGSAVAGESKRPYRSSLTVPLHTGTRPLGALELLEKKRDAGPFTPADRQGLDDLIAAADAALPAVRERAGRERDHLEVAARLTRLFDIGRTFARTLEEEPLEKIVAERVAAALEVEGAYWWRLNPDGDLLTLAAAAGPLAASVEGWELGEGEGVAGRVASTRESLLVSGDAALEEHGPRRETDAGAEVRESAAVPVTGEDGALLGVIEIVNREGDAHLGREDLIYLGEIAESAAVAFGNAKRLDAEKRANDLGSLLAASQMIGATLDVKKVTYTLVHQGAAVIRYGRAAVGLVKGADIALAAVSGKTFVDETQPDMVSLKRILQWAAGLDEGIYVVQEEDGSIDADRPETREKFAAWFAETGARSFLAVPLKDEEGRVGVLSYEANEPYAFSARDFEAAGLLAVQGTLAIRNATLYQQVPMMRLFQPFAKGDAAGGAWWTGKRKALAAGAVVALLALLIPVPLRVGGSARVLPAERRPVTAGLDGRLAQVLVHEGDAVGAGQILAHFDEGEARAHLADARAQVQACEREVTRLRAAGDSSAAAVEMARLDGLRAEAELREDELSRTVLRAPVAGVVATPRVEEAAGMRLARGDLFCEVVDPSNQRIEIAVPERDASLVAPGLPVKVMITADPTHTLLATVERVGAVAIPEDAIPPGPGIASPGESNGAVDGVVASASGDRVLLVSARLDAPLHLRPGMTGEARITSGKATLGRVLFRRPALWLRRTVWGWLP